MTVAEYMLNKSVNEAQAEIKRMSREAIERSNRRIGQLTRHTLARIELAKREHGVSK
jgi:hypothetical protein